MILHPKSVFSINGLPPVDLKGAFKEYYVRSFVENGGCGHLDFTAVTMYFNNNQYLWQKIYNVLIKISFTFDQKIQIL